MPQALVGVIVKLGVSKLVATIAANVIVAAATTAITSLLFKPSVPKPDASERELKSPTPPRIYVLGKRRVFGSSMLFVNTTDSETVDVWAYCEGPIHAVAQVYLNDDPVTITAGSVQPLPDESYAGNKVLAGYNLGAFTETAHAPVVARVPDWTVNHRGDRIVSGYLVKQAVKADEFLEVYPQGDGVTMSLVVEGRLCHDPRNPGSNPLDPATWSYTDNAALHLLWYFMTYRSFDYATRIAPRLSMWISAADDCDVAMPLKDGGTEPKYRGCVMFSAEVEPKDIEEQFRQCFDGWTGRDENGCVLVYSGKVTAPTFSVGPGMILDYEVQSFVESENTLNEIIVRHVSEPHDFNMVEPTPWRDDGDILDRGMIVSATAEYQVPSHTQARRLAKRQLARANAFNRGKVMLNHLGREAANHRFVALKIVEAGATFFDGIVEIISAERDYETSGVTLDWISVDVNTDDWNPATEDGEPAPTATKTYLSPLEAPTIISASADFSDIGQSDDLGGSSVKGVRILIAANGPIRDDLTWYARWRVNSGPWSERQYGDADPGPGVSLVTDYVPYGTMVEVQVSYGTGDGRTSAWSLSKDVDTSP